MLYLYLFILANKQSKGNRSRAGQTAHAPMRRGCTQWLWPPKLHRTPHCTWRACSASVLRCSFYCWGLFGEIRFGPHPEGALVQLLRDVTVSLMQLSPHSPNADPIFSHTYGWKVLSFVFLGITTPHPCTGLSYKTSETKLHMLRII